MNSSKATGNSQWVEWELYMNKFRLAIQSNCAETDLRKLLKECCGLYEDYLRVSSVDEALTVISGYGCSVLEIAFMWMGRWRPTSAVVLVYSTMGINLKGMNIELGNVVTKDFVDANQSCEGLDDIVPKDFIDANPFSEKQLSGLSTLHKHASDSEAEISQQMAMIQMLLVEQDTVAALKLGEMCSDETADMSEFQQLIDRRIKELHDLLQKADTLRLHTLRVLLELLSPLQAASCIVAAYDLMLALRSLSNDTPHSGA